MPSSPNYPRRIKIFSASLRPDMSRFWNQVTRNITPYTPGEQPKDQVFIKLNTNENAYPPSPRVIARIHAEASKLLLYPDPDSSLLISTFADYHQLTPGHIFAGNGSDEVLGFIWMTFFNHCDPIVYPDISYSFYPVYSDLFQLQPQCVPLNDDFTVPLDRFNQTTGHIVLANPNAPTAVALAQGEIEGLLKQNPNRLIIVDEAYVDFGAESCIPLIPQYDNLLVVQTFSKSRSLAGLRVGFALGHPDLIAGLNRIKNSFNSYTLDRLTIVGATEAILDEDYFQHTRQAIMHTRSRTLTQLRALGFQIPEPMANFMFAKHPQFSGAELYSKLREKGILVRHFNKPGISDYLRITMGTDDQMAKLHQALKDILA